MNDSVRVALGRMRSRDAAGRTPKPGEEPYYPWPWPTAEGLDIRFPARPDGDRIRMRVPDRDVRAQRPPVLAGCG
jgi:hypothetical protein